MLAPSEQDSSSSDDEEILLFHLLYATKNEDV